MKAGITIVLLLTSYFLGCLPAGAQTASGVVNAYYKVTSVNTAANTLTVDNASGLTPGQRVLVIQSKGAAIASANNSTFGDITAINSAGNYEFNTICSITASDVVLKATLLHTYDPAGAVQLVSIPSYGSVTISGTVNAIPWDPVTGKGGIVAIEASGTLYLNADIDVSGQGLQGGPLVNWPTPTYNCDFATTVSDYYLPFPASGNYTGGKKGEGITDYITGKEYGQGKLANGGGGGNNANSGGAGGGNYGAGGLGGKKSGEPWYQCHGAYPGIGGASLAAYGYSSGNNRIFFGGGGGSGHENNALGEPGGNGGGIIILSAAAIVGGGGRLLASGLSPVNAACRYPDQAEGDGGGGGGAGGTIILNAAAISGSVTAEAKGARGSDAGDFSTECTGPGGGGGAGVIWAAGGVFPAAVSVAVTGGGNGVGSITSKTAACRGLSNGALPGNAGASMSAYTAPESTTNTCIVLASSTLKYFSGYPEDGGYLLTWGLYPEEATGTIRSFTVERSVDRAHFNTLAIIAGSPDSVNYRYTDSGNTAGTLFYRLSWPDQQGVKNYSRIITRTRPPEPGIEFIRLHPNPVTSLLSVQLFSTSGEQAIIRIFTAQGQPLIAIPVTLHTGITSLDLPLGDLAAATYFLVVEGKGLRQVRSFIKR